MTGKVLAIATSHTRYDKPDVLIGHVFTCTFFDRFERHIAVRID